MVMTFTVGMSLQTFGSITWTAFLIPGTADPILILDKGI